MAADSRGPDAIFAEPRLARIYDDIEGERPDLEPYLRIVDELGARSVLDVGCGTGRLPCLLAARGLDVVGVDPAVASIEVAKARPGAERVRWLAGDAPGLSPLVVDLSLMTGNVAQVFLTDEDWAATLRGIAAAVRPGGHLVFEVRDPQARGWEAWTMDRTRRTVMTAEGPVDCWVELTDVALPFASFRWTYRFEQDGAELVSDSTLRFRSRSEIEASLGAAGFDVLDVRDAPDRPGRELVFLARSMRSE